MAIIPNEEELSIIKKCELNILREIKRICDANNINFILGGGTLIGAVRHKGFIPWDDDIDIAMLRSDYEVFIKAASDLPDYMVVLSHPAYEKYGEQMTKVMDIRAIFRERFAQNVDIPAGVFVDIFVFDNVPSNQISRMVHRFKNYTLRKMILLANDYNFTKYGWKKEAYKLLQKMIKPFPVKSLQKAYDKNAQRYNRQKTDKVVSLSGSYGYKKETVPVSYLEDLVFVEFENDMYCAPREYDAFLRSVYGDYMKLPPKEKQVNKHTLAELDLSGLGATAHRQL